MAQWPKAQASQPKKKVDDYEEQVSEHEYVCYYDIGWGCRDVIVDGLYCVCLGFWLNEKSEFTQGSDCKWWIPPSRIFFVEKVKKEKE
jgi:hypothetical protein